MIARADQPGGFSQSGAAPGADVNGARVPVSVIVLTLNEELNVAECLASCGWSDDVHVLDSGSTDRTVEVALRAGARVHEHPFESFGAQRNWAIDNVPVAHDWIFHLDADERFTPELVAAIKQLMAGPRPEAGFYVPEKLMFMGRWLKRAGSYPKYQMRLFHKARMRFQDFGHGQRELTTGIVGRLESPYTHFALSKGLHDWVEKHNRYSTLEAMRAATGSSEPWPIRALMARDRTLRRRAWKDFSYHMPYRAFARWMFTLFLQGAIVEGQPGRTYARLIALYEEMTSLKLQQLRIQARAHAADTDNLQKRQA